MLCDHLVQRNAGCTDVVSRTGPRHVNRLIDQVNLKQLRLHVVEELLVRFHFESLSVVKMWVGSASCVRSNLERVEVIAVKR